VACGELFGIVQARHSARLTAINEQLADSLDEEQRQRARADEARGAAERATGELAVALEDVEAQRPNVVGRDVSTPPEKGVRRSSRPRKGLISRPCLMANR